LRIGWWLWKKWLKPGGESALRVMPGPRVPRQTPSVRFKGRSTPSPIPRGPGGGGSQPWPGASPVTLCYSVVA
jgi:hypothetical protein